MAKINYTLKIICPAKGINLLKINWKSSGKNNYCDVKINASLAQGRGLCGYLFSCLKGFCDIYFAPSFDLYFVHPLRHLQNANYYSVSHDPFRVMGNHENCFVGDGQGTMAQPAAQFSGPQSEFVFENRP